MRKCANINKTSTNRMISVQTIQTKIKPYNPMSQTFICRGKIVKGPKPRTFGIFS